MHTNVSDDDDDDFDDKNNDNSDNKELEKKKITFYHRYKNQALERVTLLAKSY